MPATRYAEHDMRSLVVKEKNGANRTDSGVWFALSLALIFAVRIFQLRLAGLATYELHTSAPLSIKNLAI